MEETAMAKPGETGKDSTTRREFLKGSTAAVVGSAVAAGWTIPAVYAAGSDEIRVGLIGCGGRGTGAGENVAQAAPGVKIIALGDVFKDKIDSCVDSLKKTVADKLDVPEERQFVGLDAYQKVLAADVNYIILATPPGFRPLHLKAAVAAGKNIFTEKPLAVDGPGLIDCHLYRQPGRAILHLVNLTSAGTWRQPVHELIPVGPLRVRVRLPDDVRGKNLRLLVSGRKVSVTGAKGWRHFELGSLLDHEVAVLT